MSRTGNMVGSFVIEDRTGAGVVRPWTDEDAARLDGTFTIGGRATKAHVMTPAGPYVIGSVSLWCRCGRRKQWARDATCERCTRRA